MTSSTVHRHDAARVCTEFGLGELRALTRIAAGTINTNYRIDAEGGSFFLRVNEGKTEADVAYEAELVGALAGAGVPTPAPMPARTGRRYAVHDGRLLSLFPWVDGVHRAAGEVNPADATQVGGALARLHRAGLDIADQFPREGIYTFAAIAQRLDGFRDSTDPALAPAIATLSEEARWLEGCEAIRSRAARGIIHGDLFRDNVMFDGDRLAALIDFEQASTGSLAYDLAVSINAWCYGDSVDLGLAAAMAGGYRAVRELAVPEVESLYVELRAAAMRFTVTRITDVYLPGVLREGKDFRRYLARLRCWQELGPDDVRAAIGT